MENPLSSLNPLSETELFQSQTFSISEPQGQAGTTLVASKTSEGFWEKTSTHDWEIKKAFTPTSIEVCQNQTGAVIYTISVERGKGSVVDKY